MVFQITPYSETKTSLAEIEHLLNSVYVGEGFTDPKAAATMFEAKAVLARGDILVAHKKKEHRLVGMIIVVAGSSPASKLATAGEVELQLLTVNAEFRGQGAGKWLVKSALDLARKTDKNKVLLWTQPSMQIAQRLYHSLGFTHHPSKDFTAKGKDFLVFEYSLP